MAKRQVFFSFEYDKDNWRAGQVRNMGKVDGSSTFSDNDWEEVACKSEASIKNWIDSQMSKRSCIVVLIGSTTYNRKWVKYEIQKAYELGKGIVGIYVNKLKDANGNTTTKGYNPFDYVYNKYGYRLSNYVKCFDSSYSVSSNVYEDIKNNIEGLIESAISRAGSY